MSAQQVQRLQTLLETVQRNRQRPGEPISAASANVVQKKAPANTTAAAEPPPRARVQTPDLAAATPGSQPRAGKPVAPQVPAAAQAKPAPAPAPQPRAPEPQPVAQAPEPIVPRMIEPEAPRPATRPIAQLVSKHAPVVDATFGAMLKRSLSLRPH